jgi:hypothetical protein
MPRSAMVSAALTCAVCSLPTLPATDVAATLRSLGIATAMLSGATARVE